jgi:Mn-dependent DtxR family transcriptional regulator
MNPQTSLTPTAKKYLQAISWLQKETPSVRQVQVARYLKVSPSSCFESVLRLITKGLVHEDETQHLSLTKEGQELSNLISQNQCIFTNFLHDVLGCEKSEALAEKIEPHVDNDTAIALCRFENFLDSIKD